MTAGLMLSCFMCDVEVSYRKNDFSKLENHLRNEHRVSFKCFKAIISIKNIFLDQTRIQLSPCGVFYDG